MNLSGFSDSFRYVVRRLIADSKNQVKVVAIYDPDQEIAKDSAIKMWDAPDAKICTSWEEALQQDVDWAMVFSPNYAHKDQIIAAFQAGKDVFSEKTAASGHQDLFSFKHFYLISSCIFFFFLQEYPR